MYIGIDLGTSNSAIAGVNNSEIKLFKTADGTDILPSVIYIDKRGHRFYGARAYSQMALSPENVAAKFKRLMGTSTSIECKNSGIIMSPEECSADILKQLLAQAFTESGKSEVDGCIITIPAAFNQMQSEATLRAAQMAGIDKVALLQEPIAASMAAMAQSKNKNGQFLVYDLGGGTFDLALVQSISGAINILAHEGINMLGGTDFDRILVNSFVREWLIENFSLPKDFQKNSKYQKILRIAHWASEKAKIELSTRDTSIIFASDEDVRTQDENGKDIYFEIPISRTDLEKLISDEIGKTIELSKKILKDNGYGHDDIDRVVFIGGPTKMPLVRNLVPHALGIPADLQTDPMTAVAIGAAIYSESREWTQDATSRKSSRGSIKPDEQVDIRYDYPTRTSDDKAKLRIKLGSSVAAQNYQIQIDNTLGWTSGRKALSEDCVVDLPLSEIGDNDFRVTLFDSIGKPVEKASTTFCIKRTHASSVGIPATQTISVKVRESAESLTNVLEPLITKGMLLPASGSKKFRTIRDLKSYDKTDHLGFELYQDEGAKEAELNLCVGAFRICGTDLEDGVRIRSGDELIFNWTMSDSGLIKATIEVPSISQTFETKNYYAPQTGHQNFDLKNGTHIAQAVIDDAKKELEKVKSAVGDDLHGDVGSIDNEIQKQESLLKEASEEDTTRFVTESVRKIRQAISHIKHNPNNQRKVLMQELASHRNIFDEWCRETSDQKMSDKFNGHATRAEEALKKNDLKSLQDAGAHIAEMYKILADHLWSDPEFLFRRFKKLSDQVYLAIDKALFEQLIKQGVKNIEDNDISALRRTVFEIHQNMVSLGSEDDSVKDLASIMRS